jgi:glycosyltransferase involved in cell wall biosynthesis
MNNDRICILHVIPTLGVGGTETNALRLAEYLQNDNRIENIILANSPGDESMRAAFQAVSSAPVVALSGKRLYRLATFKSELKKNEVDAIVFHFFNIDQALMAVIVRMTGVTSCIAAAGTAATGISATNLRKWQIAILFNRLAKTPIVSASKWIETTLAALTKLPLGSHVIPNGVDVSKFGVVRETRLARPHRRECWTLGMVARLESAKDHAALIRGFSQFLEQVPEATAHLRIIGDGPLRGELERLTRDIGTSEHVTFLGSRHDVPEQLAQLDAFVFSTTSKEGFGNVLIEALAAGVPIIANDVPSSREVLQDGKSGTLVPGGSPNAWAQTLSESWRNGPIDVPSVKEINEIYSISQFSNSYLRALGIPTQGIISEHNNDAR